METRKEISSLYILKTLCALFVVMIHTPFWGKDILSPIIRCAVPCFFLISGYFLYSDELKKTREKLLKTLKKIFVAILVTNAVYLICKLINGRIFSWGEITDIFITGESICLPLWYLTAYAWALVFLLIFLRKTDRLLVVFPIFFLGHLLMARYSFVFFPGIEFLSGERTNALTVALPILSLGYLIHKYESRILYFRSPLAWIGMFAFFSYVEQYLLSYFQVNNDLAYLASTLPLACAMFLIALKHKDFHIPYVCAIGKLHSSNIYYFHMLSWNVVLSHIPMIYSICAEISFVATLGGSVVLVWLQNKARQWQQNRLQSKEATYES